MRPSKQLDAVMPVEGKVRGSRASSVLSRLDVLPGMGSKRPGPLWCDAFGCLLMSWGKVSMKEPCRKPIPPSSSSDKASSAVVGVRSLGLKQKNAHHLWTLGIIQLPMSGWGIMDSRASKRKWHVNVKGLEGCSHWQGEVGAGGGFSGLWSLSALW